MVHVVSPASAWQVTYNAAINACENSAEWLQVRLQGGFLVKTVKERSMGNGTYPQDELMIADDTLW